MNAAVIIPAYDPEENLLKLVNRIWDLGNQVIVVDDGSAVDRQPLFERLSEKAIVLHHVHNFGKGTAIKTALAYIRDNLWECSVIGVMDADGQHLPEDMEKLLMKANLNEDSMVLGVRKIGADMPMKSRLGNAITRIVFQIASGLRVSDTQTGLRAFSAKMIEKLIRIEGARYEYETNVLFFCAREKIPIKEVPIRTIYHDRENSCSHFRPVMDSLRIYKDILKFSAASFSSFLLDYLLFCLLTGVLPASAFFIFLANVLARLMSGTFNYCVNCRFVFGSKARKKTAVQYLMLAFGILALNNVFLWLYSIVIGIPVYHAKILTELTLFVISFAVQRTVIFRGLHSNRCTL